ncbi:class I adenylate-forming enzyme family protein [Kitasatospora sp. NPDC003701]
MLAGPDSEICLEFERPVTRSGLRALVARRREALAEAGLGPGGRLALRLPPSLACAVELLAAWQLGAQVALLDHRLTEHEIGLALERLAPRLLVEPLGPVTATALRGFHRIEPRITRLPGRAGGGDHVLIQLSSGSTGPSKVIGRSAADLLGELARYDRIEGFPRRGERVVMLASMVHVLGLVGGLLYSLHGGARMVVPERFTVDGILRAVAAAGEPTTVLGVPFHAEILAAVTDPPQLPFLRGMITGGEPVRQEVWEAFTTRYHATLGNMYGMTEAGVIATDVAGRHRPELAVAPGLDVRVTADEILLGLPVSPYLDAGATPRWEDGWLRTRDAGALDPATGRLRVRGRLDSQISVGGLKVDLAEVEQTVLSLPQVREAVVLHGHHIEAYLTLSEPAGPAELEQALAARLAPYKRPRSLHVLPDLPRTGTGKLVRDPAALRGAVERARS